MKPLNLIVAMDQRNGIGKAGKLPWNLPEDMRHFKSVTLTTTVSGLRNAVVMGRKTWESIPERFRPLAGRLNVVLTHQGNYPLPADVLRAKGLEEAMALCSERQEKERIDQVFVIGGASVYQQAIGHPLCRTIYVTKIEGDFGCDAFFPDFEKDFKGSERSPDSCANGIRYYFCTYVRK